MLLFHSYSPDPRANICRARCTAERLGRRRSFLPSPPRCEERDGQSSGINVAQGGRGGGVGVSYLSARRCCQLLFRALPRWPLRPCGTRRQPGPLSAAASVCQGLRAASEMFLRAAAAWRDAPPCGGGRILGAQRFLPLIPKRASPKVVSG